jgi:hypothetical protein
LWISYAQHIIATQQLAQLPDLHARALRQVAHAERFERRYVQLVSSK